ncbi:MAG: hypothetical protein LIP01_00570 [Tannerellaceae bacterium]|nr:hypothetical protein [Tannerellaceae bacterium]
MKVKYIVLIWILLNVLSSCSDFEELNRGPNNPTEIPPVNLLNGIIKDSWEGPWGGEHSGIVSSMQPDINYMDIRIICLGVMI